MHNPSNPPVIAFELGAGEFRIVTPEAVYQIKVLKDLPNAGHGQNSAEGTSQNINDQKFFMEISKELFDKIGRLARQLAVSVEDLPEQFENPNFSETGKKPEAPQEPLEEIIHLTEKASMTIMDAADEIQNNLEQLKNQLAIIQNLDIMSAAGAPKLLDNSPPAGQAVMNPDFFNTLGELKGFIEDLLAASQPEKDSTPPGNAPPDAEKKPIELSKGAAVFEADAVFQGLYELCTNDSVKSHIKTMQEQKLQAFNEARIETRLSELAEVTASSEGFYNFSIPVILKTLYMACLNEDFKLVLKKMNQTAPSIFCDRTLPLEGMLVVTGEMKTPLRPPAPLPARCSVSDLETLLNLSAELEELSRPDANGPILTSTTAPCNSISPKDRKALTTSVNLAHSLIQQTSGRLTCFMKSLPGQDLPSQSMMPEAGIINRLQLQLLSILVSASAKFKVHQQGGLKTAPLEANELKVQAEVDEVLEKAAQPSKLSEPAGEARLNQSAVNDLLSRLGF